MSSPPKISRFRRIADVVRKIVGFDEGLHRCPACGSAFVCPMDWTPDGEERWIMQLRCAQCETWREVRLSNEETRDFELALDRQTAVIERELHRIERERMQEELDLLVFGFEHDLIDATDFAG